MNANKTTQKRRDGENKKKKVFKFGLPCFDGKKGRGEMGYIYILKREREREKSGQVFYFFLLTYIFKQGYKKDTSALQGPNP